jgi:mannose-6-phosphate isomerase
LYEKQIQPGEHKGQRIEKPWGYELIWANTDHYVGKILFVKAGESLSLQYHEQKEETLFIETGNCLIEAGTSIAELKPHHLSPGSIFHVAPTFVHRIEAKTDCRIFEVSTTQLTDVVRIKDRYGRG